MGIGAFVSRVAVRSLFILSSAMAPLGISSAHADMQTRIDGKFDGCAYDKVYPLQNGLLLVCHEFFYMSAYSPEVIILDDGRAVINGEIHQASIERASILHTYVLGNFEGCRSDNAIALANGLTFICDGDDNRYHSYEPDVQITVLGSRYKVYIGGDQYDGKLVKRN